MTAKGWKQRTHKRTSVKGTTFSAGKKKTPMYEVFVDNIGNVYRGKSLSFAKAHFNNYVAASKTGKGRAGDSNVFLIDDNNVVKSPIKEYYASDPDPGAFGYTPGEDDPKNPRNMSDHDILKERTHPNIESLQDDKQNELSKIESFVKKSVSVLDYEDWEWDGEVLKIMTKNGIEYYSKKDLKDEGVL